MFFPGDVFGFHSEEAGKWKYHLCISLHGHFLFINSPKEYRAYPGDLIVPCSELPFLKPTPSGESIISCTLVMRKTASNLRGAKKLGTISTDLLKTLVGFIENSPVIPDVTREQILDGLGDWL